MCKVHINTVDFVLAGRVDINESVEREMTPDARDALLTDYGISGNPISILLKPYVRMLHTKTDKIASYASLLRDMGLYHLP